MGEIQGTECNTQEMTICATTYFSVFFKMKVLREQCFWGYTFIIQSQIHITQLMRNVIYAANLLFELVSNS